MKTAHKGAYLMQLYNLNLKAQPRRN